MKYLVVLALLLPSAAFAQQGSPEFQALGAKLMSEINAGIQCNANAIAGRAELEKVQAELKAMKDKYEPQEKKDKSTK